MGLLLEWVGGGGGQMRMSETDNQYFNTVPISYKVVPKEHTA